MLLFLFFETPCCPKYVSCGPVSNPAHAWLCPIPLPESARDIQYKHLEFFGAYETYVRFEAPVEECKVHAKKMLDDWEKTFTPTHGRPGPLAPIDKVIPIHHPSTACQVPWFDIELIRDGLSTNSPGPMIPQIWINTDRGIFYYMMTD